MNELPILFMSKEMEGREHIADITLNNLAVNLYTFDIPKMIYFSVAGSHEYFEKLCAIAKTYGMEVRGLRFDKCTPGYAWNEVIKIIFNDGHDVFLRMEDDFKLKDTLDIRPYAELLESNQNVGMVRLGLMPIDLNLRSVGWYDSMNQGHIFFDCLPSSPYAYSGNPGLVHKRLHDAVGYFHEEHNPGDIEIDFDSRVRDKMREGGPRIWWPLDLGKFSTYGAWDHIGDVKSY